MRNKIWETEETPEIWNVSDIKMIYKGKGKKRKVNVKITEEFS